MLKKVMFDDFVRLGRGFDLPDDKIIAGEYPVVTSTNIKAYHNEYKILPPVVVTGRSGSLGKVQYIDEKCWPLNTALYSKDFRNNVPRYVCYFLQTMHLEQYNAGAGVPTLNQNHLHRLKINIHEIEEQEKVVSVLSTYDDLIENNNKRIKLLEQMVENLYKEWFVRFRFPGYELAKFENGIPKGWRFAKLKDVAKEVGKSIDKDNLNGYQYYLPIDCIPNKSMALQSVEDISKAESSLHSFKKEDILFGAMRPYFHKVLYAPFDGITRKTCFVIKAKEKEYIDWLYLLLYQKNTVNFATTVSVGSTMPYVRWNDFSRMNIVVPDKKTAQEFSEKASPILKRINIFFFENENLAKQRDLLLPRLMSGKLEV